MQSHSRITWNTNLLKSKVIKISMYAAFLQILALLESRNILLKYWLCSTVETVSSNGYKISCYPALLEAVLDVHGQSRWLNCSAKHTLSQVSIGNSGNLHVSPGVTLLHFMLSHQVMAKLTKAGITRAGLH